MRLDAVSSTGTHNLLRRVRATKVRQIAAARAYA
jgi:hypothetical protein